jgi:hypothetical protein
VQTDGAFGGNNEAQALAADLLVKAPVSKAVYDWTGFYVGGHFGYGGGSLGADANPLPLQGVFFPHSATGLIGGYQIGYNREFANNVVLGSKPTARSRVRRTKRRWDGCRLRPSTPRSTISAPCVAVSATRLGAGCPM